MQQEFWHERWEQNQIGFHNEEVNRHLQQFWPALNVTPGSRVFVPLCGKSHDLLWLRAQGYEVIGVELSPLATQAFFAENNLSAVTRQHGNFHVSETAAIQLFCGDFFALDADDLAGVSAVYDRAALVALPPEMRTAYTQHMRQVLPSGSKTLLVAFDYPQHQMQGPPFSVQTQEVRSLYRPWCDIRLIHSEDIIGREPQFRDRGITRMQEQIYFLTGS